MKHWILVLLLFPSVIFGQSLTLFSPPKDATIYKDIVLFKGKTEGVKKVSINDVDIPLTDNRFFIRITVDKLNATNTFTIKAETESGDIITETRNVTRKPGKTSPHSTLSFFPQDKAQVTYDTIALAGTAKDIDSLYINNQFVIINPDGRYKHVVTLENTEDFNFFQAVGYGKDGILHILPREIFLKKKHKKQKKQQLAIDDVTTSTLKEIQAQYESFEWKTSKLTLNKPPKLKKKLWEKIATHHLLMEHEEELLLALPFYKINAPITDISSQLTAQIQTEKNIKVLWFNANQHYWEMFYTPKAPDAYLWLINDTEIPPTNLTQKDLNTINSFLRYPFI